MLFVRRKIISFLILIFSLSGQKGHRLSSRPGSFLMLHQWIIPCHGFWPNFAHLWQISPVRTFHNYLHMCKEELLISETDIRIYQRLSSVLVLHGNNFSECLLLLFVAATLLATPLSVPLSGSVSCYHCYLIVRRGLSCYHCYLSPLLRLKHLVTEASLPLNTKSKYHHH